MINIKKVFVLRMGDVRFLVAEEIARVYSKETTWSLPTIEDKALIILFCEYNLGKNLIKKHQVDEIVVEWGDDKYLILYSAGKPTKDLSPTDHNWLRIIQKDFLDGNPVHADIHFEGQKLNENGDLVLGCRAGPGKDISNLIHEMAHLAEREIPKLIKRPYYNWDFTYGKYWEIMGRSGHEPWTDQSTRREMRVWAYQWSFMQHYGILLNKEKHSLYNMMESIRFVNSWHFYQNKHEFNNLEYREREEAQIRVASEEIAELARTKFTFEAFVAAWNERMIALKEHPVSIENF